MKKLTKLAQRHTPPTILHPRPGQRRVQVIASVQKDGARFQIIHHVFERNLVLGPDGRREAIGRIVHQREGFGVGRDGLDADDGTECFFLFIFV